MSNLQHEEYDRLSLELNSVLELVDGSYGADNLSGDDIISLTDIRVNCDQLINFISELKQMTEAEAMKFEHVLVEVPEFIRLVKSGLSPLKGE